MLTRPDRRNMRHAKAGTLQLGENRSGRSLSRYRVGCAVARRPASIRNARTRRRAGRPVVVDDLEQARRLPRGVRRLRYRRGRPVHAEADRRADARCEHRAQSREDRSRRCERARGPADSRGTRLARRIPVVVRRSFAAAERVGVVSRRACVDRAFGRAQQGAQALRLQVRRLDDLLCVDAGDGHGQRPRKYLPVPCALCGAGRKGLPKERPAA
ncbi:putative dNA-3-methyladenine glycosylase I [Burkholderia pseudomallei MSHR733]|nr:putative dNA-3-methyladenine glycosylase I [Burkholderia pseudomallei MSHR733]